jgi:hypothetical protein
MNFYFKSVLYYTMHNACDSNQEKEHSKFRKTGKVL